MDAQPTIAKRQPPKRKKGDGKDKLRTIDGEAMDVRTGSAFIGCSEKATRAGMARGLIPYRDFGGRKILLRSELRQMLAALPGVTLQQAQANQEARHG